MRPRKRATGLSEIFHRQWHFNCRKTLPLSGERIVYMKEQYVVTISHLFGSGGAAIGRKLSQTLSVPFVDRQILKRVADFLCVPEASLEDREERKATFWQAFSRMELYNDPITLASYQYLPTDRELYDLETHFIREIVKESSCVLLGRGGRFILRDHPRHLSVFVCADSKDRIARTAKIQQVDEDVARKIVEKNDKERAGYLKTFTGLDVRNASDYDICVNTSGIGLDNAAALILQSLKYKGLLPA